MAVQNSKFLSSSFNSAFVPTSAYYQQLSAASVALAAYEGWSHLDLLSSQLTQTSPTSIDEALQMHHLRFPTPPITPPYYKNTHKLPANTQTPNVRTKSVIMKIGQDHLDSNIPPTPEHVDDMAVDIIGLEDTTISPEINRHETMTMHTSSTSSASSTPKRSEYVCEWIDCGR